MDEFIKKIIEYKDDLRTLYPTLISSYDAIKIGNTDFRKRGGIGYLPKAYFKIFNYNVNSVLWSNDGWELRKGLGYHNTAYQLNNMNYDAISFSFGGCSMARFCYNNAEHYITHIQSSKNFNEDKRLEFIKFVRDNGDKISIKAMFRPDCDDNILNAGNLQLWGVITKECNCYSVYVQCIDKNGRWTVPYDQDCEKIHLCKIKSHLPYQEPIHSFLDTIKQRDWTPNSAPQMISEWNRFFTGQTRDVWMKSTTCLI